MHHPVGQGRIGILVRRFFVVKGTDPAQAGIDMSIWPDDTSFQLPLYP
jgi:hypothetical protein